MVYSVIFGASRDAKSVPGTAMTNIYPLRRTVVVLELQVGWISLIMPGQSAIFDQIRLLPVKRQRFFSIECLEKDNPHIKMGLLVTLETLEPSMRAQQFLQRCCSLLWNETE